MSCCTYLEGGHRHDSSQRRAAAGLGGKQSEQKNKNVKPDHEGGFFNELLDFIDCNNKSKSRDFGG